MSERILRNCCFSYIEEGEQEREKEKIAQSLFSFWLSPSVQNGQEFGADLLTGETAPGSSSYFHVIFSYVSPSNFRGKNYQNSFCILRSLVHALLSVSYAFAFFEDHELTTILSATKSRVGLRMQIHTHT